MRISSQGLRATAAALAFGLFGCKPTTSSSTQSLDNFARSGGEARLNVCSGDFTVEAVRPNVEIESTLANDPTRVKALEAAFNLAYSAVPDQYRSLLAYFPGSVVRIAQGVDRACSQRLSTSDKLYAAEGGKLQACWDPTARTIDIYLEADPVAIQHHLVRMYARAATELIADAPYAMTSEQRKKIPNFVASVAGFREFQGKLSAVFTSELEANAKQGAKVSLDSYKPLILGNKTQRRTFDNYVFAESFDSYYCNKSAGGTRDRFKAQYPRTYAVFVSYAKRLEADTNVQVLAQSRAAQNGRGLTSAISPPPWLRPCRTNLGRMVRELQPFLQCGLESHG